MLFILQTLSLHCKYYIMLLACIVLVRRVDNNMNFLLLQIIITIFCFVTQNCNNYYSKCTVNPPNERTFLLRNK